MTIENFDLCRGHGRNFDHLTMFFLKFWPWSWSKFFDHMTMTPGRWPNGQKIMVALPPQIRFRSFDYTVRVEEIACRISLLNCVESEL